VYKFLQCTPQQLKVSSSKTEKKYDIVVYHTSNIITKTSEMKKQARLSKQTSKSTTTDKKNINLPASYVSTQPIYGAALIVSEEKFGKTELDEIVQRTIISIKNDPKGYQLLLSNPEFKNSMLQMGTNMLNNVGSSTKLDEKAIRKMATIRTSAADGGAKQQEQLIKKITKQVDAKKIADELGKKSTEKDVEPESKPIVIDPSKYTGLAAELALDKNIVDILSTLNLDDKRKLREVPDPKFATDIQVPSIPKEAISTAGPFGSQPRQVEVIDEKQFNDNVERELANN
jgi:hypothetical protein